MVHDVEAADLYTDAARIASAVNKAAVRAPFSFHAAPAMVVPQQAPQTFSALNYAVGLADAFLELDQAIGQALVVPFTMVVVHELLNGATQTGLAEENHPLQAFGFDGSDEMLGDGIPVGALGRQLDRLHTCYFKHSSEGLGEQRVPIVDQVIPSRQEIRPAGPSGCEPSASSNGHPDLLMPAI